MTTGNITEHFQEFTQVGCPWLDSTSVLGKSHFILIIYKRLQTSLLSFLSLTTLIMWFMAQFSLNNVHKRGLKHHHFIYNVIYILSFK